ncbi:MAG: aminotransferase [Alphaproteobacteria bacterium]|nr:aminotransferase [Alphaproteobacteria bacterium]
MVKSVNPQFAGMPTTIFAEMSALAREHGAVNLGQGFPDEDGPEEIRQAAADYLMDGLNQYPPLYGLPELRQAIARHDKRHYEMDVEWETQVMVTSGATEALTSSILAFLERGDEAVVFEPVYDSYAPIIELAGATCRPIRLEAPKWELPEDIESAFGEKTKLIMLNSPMNPIGKVFSDEELTRIAELAQKYDCYVICDEVYEHLIFDRLKHKPLLKLSGMAERTVRIGSAGKIFSLTGWKVGFIVGTAELIEQIAKVHQFVTFTVPPNLQAGVAFGLDNREDFYRALGTDLAAKRDRLTEGLKAIGFEVGKSQGTYFVVADLESVGVKDEDRDFSRRLISEGGVGSIPLSPFYLKSPPTNLLRFCFCKRDDVIDEGLAKLKAFFGA